MRILQVAMFDVFGGAEKVAWNLFEAYRSRGHESWFAVGRKRSEDPNVLVIANDRARSPWPRFWWWVHHRLQPYYSRAARVQRLCRMAHRLAEPESLIEMWRGLEDFNYPGTWRLLDLPPRPPELVHCHNLHQKYFDLRALPSLSRRVPVVLTLHDAWLLSGHCAHSFNCTRWETGCGQCPDLTIHPSVRRDATALNWRRKRDIYEASRLFVCTPSQWLMEKVRRSLLAPAVAETRVIANGVDRAVFRPADRLGARIGAGLPQDALILLFVASSIRRNPWKDWQTLRAAVARASEVPHARPLLFVALGEQAPPLRAGRAEIRFVPFEQDPAAVARYYQAADVYIHAARADTFPCTVLEALACGTPVVASAVGGIPEQVRSLGSPEAHQPPLGADPTSATGILVPCGDAERMSAAITRLVADATLRRQLGENAATDARARFDLHRQADAYLQWYEELLARR